MGEKKTRFAVITDSASDISPAQVREWGVSVVPLNVIIGDEQYRDGVDLTSEEFYQMLESRECTPSTSQPSPAEFVRAFERELEHAQEVVCVTISGDISGTFQSACIARSLLLGDNPKRVHIVDSRNLCVGELLLVNLAVRLRDTGACATEAVATLEKLRERIRIVAVFDTLEYMKRGGRIPKSAALAGQMLSIKPVVGVENGKIVLLGKARGSKSGRNMAAKETQKHGGPDRLLPFFFGYTGNDDSVLREYMKTNEHLYGTYSDDVEVNLVGSTIGTHAGPGAVAVAFFSNK